VVFTEREALVRYRYRWSDADKNSDQKLDRNEFMTFRHPEQSNLTMANMVHTIMNGLGKFDRILTNTLSFVNGPFIYTIQQIIVNY